MAAGVADRADGSGRPPEPPARRGPPPAAGRKLRIDTHMGTIKTMLRRHLPLLDLLVYYRSARRDGLLHGTQLAHRFDGMLNAAAGGRCLQVGVRGQKFGPNWTAIDLCDRSPTIDSGMDVQHLAFPDQTFDAVTCNAVLECVPDPAQAIAELGRVLRPGGDIWIEIPFVQAHHPSAEQGWKDYWRVSVRGLQLWMSDFEEVSCGMFGTPIWNGVYFHGRKPRQALVAVPKCS
jgi:SAM-dependent methyltransferase